MVWGYNEPLLATPYDLAVAIARCALFKRVEAIIFIDCIPKMISVNGLINYRALKGRTLVIFSIFRTDLSRISISRSVAILRAACTCWAPWVAAASVGRTVRLNIVHGRGLGRWENMGVADQLCANVSGAYSRLPVSPHSDSQPLATPLDTLSCAQKIPGSAIYAALSTLIQINSLLVYASNSSPNT